MTTPVAASGTDDAALFRVASSERNMDAVWIAATLTAVINPCFALLDRVLIPENAPRLLTIRSGLELLALGVLLLLWRAPRFALEHDIGLGLGLMAVTAWSIEAMVFLHVGYSSPYYAGICLVIITTGYLFLVTARTAAVFHLAVYVPFIVPAVLGLARISNVALFLTHQLFLLSTILIVYVSQRVKYRLEERDFHNRLALERTKISLQDALGSLTKMDELKSQFFNNVTHELRTPLTMILAPIESMRNGDLGALTREQLDLMEGIWRNGIRLLKLINDLLDLARASEKFLFLQISPTHLDDTVSAIVEYARPLAARKQIELEFDVGAELHDVRYDAEKMERVIVNLLSNALKFTPDGGKVSVVMGIRGETAFIAVRDTGIGIAEEKLATIFERFSQADASVTRRFGGTGIGLAFAESIVQLHGGTIEVESTLGQGSTFTVLLPRGAEHLNPKVMDRRRRQDPLLEDQRRRGEDQGPREWAARLTDLNEYRFLNLDEVTDRRRIRRGRTRSNAARVLVVEDNLDVAEFLHLQLQDEYTVFVASNGKEGLALATEKKPDAIISDYMMPEMDGLTMLSLLRADEKTADIPVIMLTAKAQLADRLDARQAGADVYLSKPFSPQELRTAVAQQIRRRAQMAGKLLQSNVRNLEVVSAGLSHEINNPLNYIRAASTVVSESLQGIAVELDGLGEGERATKVRGYGERASRMCDAIDVGVQKIERIVHLMRRYAQEGYSHVPLPISIDASVRDITRLVLPRGDKQVKIELDLAAADATVLMVAEELHQSISNLIQNAVDAVGNGGRVRVRTRCTSDEITFEVEDDGPGVEPDLRDRIFMPFFTTKAAGDGLGLGLAITRKVITDAGGTVEVGPGPDGTGAIFRITLPARDHGGRPAVHAGATTETAADALSN